MLNNSAISQLIASPDADEALLIAPKPEPMTISKEGAASIDLRLGTWFITTRLSRHSLMDIYSKNDDYPTEANITARHYVPFGKKFILHPRSFVLAATLEWIRMPKCYAGYVIGKSSWGRRGLIIETASGVHPGFTGCLTLELANVGEIPIALMPGTKICQLFLHKLEGTQFTPSESLFNAHRQPRLGQIRLDEFAEKLRTSEE
jgi:dCTP deaminase